MKKMAVETYKNDDNVIVLETVASEKRFWAASQQFGVICVAPSTNESYAPTSHEGAQTSDFLLNFLHGVTR
jgi:hypothetical protein